MSIVISNKLNKYVSINWGFFDTNSHYVKKLYENNSEPQFVPKQVNKNYGKIKSENGE